MILEVDKAQVSAPYGETGKWVFFGVTYDGNLTTNNVLFYKGFRTSREAGGPPAVSCISTSTINKGKTDANTTTLAVGNQSSYDRPFKGWFDNLRLHASYHDGDGALSLAQLEALRAADYNVPPAGTILHVR